MVFYFFVSWYWLLFLLFCFFFFFLFHFLFCLFGYSSFFMSLANIFSILFMISKTISWGEQDGREVRGLTQGSRRSTPLSTDTSEIHLQTQKRMQNTSWEWTGAYLTSGKGYIEWHKAPTMKELGRKTRVWVGLTCPQQVGEPKQGSDPHIRATVWVGGETFKAESETADLWKPKWNENQTALATAIHTPDRHVDSLEGIFQGRFLGFLGNPIGWELEVRDCGAIPGRGLLLTAERQIEGMWGRRLWWEMPVEESQVAMEARWYCWLRVTTRRVWCHHYSLSPPTHQHWQLNHREASWSNAWCTELQSRTHPRCSFKCLTLQSTE